MRLARSLMAAAAVVTCIGAVPAGAHRVYPMSYELAPSGSGANTLIRIENTTDRPITLEMVAEKRAWDEYGKETRTPADDDFILLPVQTIVQPGKTQAVRVQYVGPPVTDDTAMYVIGVNQVPVVDPNAPTGVQFVVNFGTAAYVVPPGAKSQLRVASVQQATQAGMIEVKLENSGNRHAPLGSTTWTFKNGAGATMELKGDPLREALVASIVPSHGKRTYLVPAAKDFALTAPLSLEIK